MRSKAGSGESLGNVVKDIGIMNEIHCGNALEQVGTNAEFMINSRKYNILVSTNETYSPCKKKDKNQIRIIKGRSHRHEARRWVPTCFCDFGLVWEADIYSCTYGTDDQTGMEKLTGDTP